MPFWLRVSLALQPLVAGRAAMPVSAFWIWGRYRAASACGALVLPFLMHFAALALGDHRDFVGIVGAEGSSGIMSIGQNDEAGNQLRQHGGYRFVLHGCFGLGCIDEHSP